MAVDDAPGAGLTPSAAASGRSTGSFSYSGDPSTSDADAVRFLIGDTDPDSYLLNDAEIVYLLAVAEASGNTNPILQAAGAAAEAIAAALSREISYSADGVSVSGDTLASKFYTVGEKIRTIGLRGDVVAGPDVGGILVAESYDSTIRPLTFAVGMHDNYLAGQQDFGGQWSPYWWYNPATVLMAQQNAALVQEARTTVRR